jgi:ELWxxDGT repeat protein
MVSPVLVGGKLIFSADASNIGANTLWASDGTSAGTAAVPAVAGKTGNGQPDNFFQWGGAPYHLGVFGGTNLYRTSLTGHDSIGKLMGTAGATRLQIDTMGSMLYYIYSDQFSGGIRATNGTPGNNSAVAGPASQLLGNSLAAVNNKLFYPAVSAGVGQELVMTDLATNTFSLVKDINTGQTGSDPVMLGKLGNKVFFTAETQASGRELWVSDGTSAGTVMLVDANPGTGHGNPVSFTVSNGKAYFRAQVNVGQNKTLWATDGTPSGTTEVWGRSGTTIIGTAESDLINMGSFLIFAGGDTAGREPWRTDGTTAGTYRIKDIFPRRNGVNNSSTFENWYRTTNIIDGRFYFGATGDTLDINDTEPWVTDGTDTGTHQVANLRPGASRSMTSDAFEFVKYNSRIYFVGNNGQTGLEIYSFPAPPPVSQGGTPPPPPPSQSVGSTIDAQTFMLYPNPTTGVVSIDGAQQGDAVSVWDAAGRLMIVAHPQQSMLDVSTLPAGHYSMQLIRAGKILGTASLLRQ